MGLGILWRVVIFGLRGAGFGLIMIVLHARVYVLLLFLFHWSRSWRGPSQVYLNGFCYQLLCAVFFVLDSKCIWYLWMGNYCSSH